MSYSMVVKDEGPSKNFKFKFVSDVFYIYKTIWFLLFSKSLGQVRVSEWTMCTSIFKEKFTN